MSVYEMTAWGRLFLVGVAIFAVAAPVLLLAHHIAREVEENPRWAARMGVVRSVGRSLAKKVGLPVSREYIGRHSCDGETARLPITRLGQSQ
jgi:hypothetical protein